MSLYPVPILRYSPGTEIAGLILVDANLFGYNKGLRLNQPRFEYALKSQSD